MIDPELGIDIVDLGLVYAVQVDTERVTVVMTMTTPACPLGGLIQARVEQALEPIFPDRAIEVSLVWHPPWTSERMSPAAKQMLGFGE